MDAPQRLATDEALEPLEPERELAQGQAPKRDATSRAAADWSARIVTPRWSAVWTTRLPATSASERTSSCCHWSGGAAGVAVGKGRIGS